MRKFLLLSGLMLLVQLVISQNLNIAEHIAVDITGEIASIHSRSYYLSNTTSDCCNSQVSVVCRNDSGKELFRINFGAYRIGAFGRLIKTNDNGILVSGFSVNSCDTGPDENYIAKMDSNGAVLFNTVIQMNSGNWSPLITGMTQHMDSSYYLVSASDLFHYSSTGQFISKISSGLTKVSSIIALNNGNLLLNGLLGGIRKNVIMSTSGLIISQQTCLNIITKFIETPNYILARTRNGILEKYNSSLTIQGSSNLSGTLIIKDVFLRNDSIFVTGNDSLTQNLFYSILNPAFSILFQTQTNYKGIQPSGITINNKNKVHIVTTSSSNVDQAYSFTSLYRLGINGFFNSHSDIGVVGLSDLNAALLGNGSAGSYITPYTNADVIVKNFGTDTVKSFYLNHYAFVNGGISWCYVLLHKLCNVTISPGSTISVSTGTFYGQPFTTNPPGSVMISKKIDLCIFTTVPNWSNDIEIDNDTFCDSVLFTVTGIKENTLLSQSIQIYPNPFTDNVTINSAVEIKTIGLFNSFGELILKEIVNSKEYSFSERRLSSGIYFIKIETEKGTATKKIIKQ